MIPAAPDLVTNPEAHAGNENSFIGQLPPHSPPLAALVQPKAESARRVENMPEAQSRNTEPEGLKEVAQSTADEHTPKSEVPPPASASASTAEQRNSGEGYEGEEVKVPESGSSGMFAPNLPESSNVTDFAHALVLTPNTSGQARNSTSKQSNTLITNAPEHDDTSWRYSSTQTVIGPGFTPGSTRPTSVPNLQNRRREGPEYPTYPDQSFQALQSQVYPTPYSPAGLPYSVGIGSSYPSQNFSSSSTDVQAIKDVPHANSGSKTVGNTPAQSPGLFSPLFPNKKQWAGGSDDGRCTTPMLHPTHQRVPKE